MWRAIAAGDTIRINGTIAKQAAELNQLVGIRMFDPNNRMVENEVVSGNGETGTFEKTFIAGIVKELDPDDVMRESGNYTVRVYYVPPYIYGEEKPTEIVNFTFAYKALD